MGVFAEYQPRYAEHGVATFPLLIEGKDKKPATKGYAKTGIKGSEQLALKFPELDAFAFMAGKRSNITIVDIDDPGNEDLLREVLRRYGDTPMITKTGSGGFHCYYRHGGEARKIRFDPQMPVDVLGGGVAAAAPSKGSGKAYELIRGSLDDLARLPYIRNGAHLAEVQETVQRELVQEGGRNKALFEYLRGQARHTDDLAGLIDVGRSYADQHMDRTGGHPFTDDEVQNVAKSVWDWTEKQIAAGTYFVGTGRRMTKSFEAHDTAMALGPYAFTLSEHLKRQFGGLSSFYIANDMRNHMPGGEWPRRKFTEARAALVEAGIIKEKHRASSYYGAAVFEWT